MDNLQAAIVNIACHLVTEHSSVKIYVFTARLKAVRDGGPYISFVVVASPKAVPDVSSKPFYIVISVITLARKKYSVRNSVTLCRLEDKLLKSLGLDVAIYKYRGVLRRERKQCVKAHASLGILGQVV